MIKSRRRLWLWLTLVPLALLGLVVGGGTLFVRSGPEGEYHRVTSPDGRYIAIATFPFSATLAPAFPGQAGDKHGHIRIIGAEDGIDYGRIPVVMVSQIYDLRWEDTGASICCVGEWSFGTRDLWYWNEDQTDRIHGSAE